MRGSGETAKECILFADKHRWSAMNLSLATRGAHVLRLAGKSKHGELTCSDEASFEYTIDPRCADFLRQVGALGGVGAESYYTTNEVSWADTAHENEYLRFDLHPLCYDYWQHLEDRTAQQFLEDMLNVNSAARGTFGVRHELQEFGHGDRMFLDFLLSRFLDPSASGRSPGFAEFGTLRGVTSLYLGMAARLRGGTLATFDVEDFRAPEVKAAWLDNMHFHRRDLSGAWWADEGTLAAVREAVSSARLVLVDHVDRFAFAKRIAPWLQPAALLLVHDFPYEASEEEWHSGMLALGCERHLANLQDYVFHSHLAMFQKL